MIQDEPDLKAMQELVKALDKVLGVGDWQESLFLRGVEKKVRDLRTEAAELVNQLSVKANVKTPGAAKLADSAVQSLMETVYISIYQHDPNDIRKWEKTLKVITEYSVTRPIYNQEDYVQEMIRARPDPNKEAYIAVDVKTADIIKGLAGKAAADKVGHELLAIRDGGVLPRNIKKFVHAGKIYQFADGVLKLVNSQTLLPE